VPARRKPYTGERVLTREDLAVHLTIGPTALTDLLKEFPGLDALAFDLGGGARWLASEVSAYVASVIAPQLRRVRRTTPKRGEAARAARRRNAAERRAAKAATEATP